MTVPSYFSSLCTKQDFLKCKLTFKTHKIILSRNAFQRFSKFPIEAAGTLSAGRIDEYTAYDTKTACKAFSTFTFHSACRDSKLQIPKQK